MAIIYKVIIMDKTIEKLTTIIVERILHEADLIPNNTTTSINSPKYKWESIKSALLNIDSYIKAVEGQRSQNGRLQDITYKKVKQLIDYINMTISNATR